METLVLLLLFFLATLGFGTIGGTLLKQLQRFRHKTKEIHKKNYMDLFL